MSPSSAIAPQNNGGPVTAESELTYTPPQVVDDSADFNQSLKDIVSEIEDEFADSKYEFTDDELAESDGEIVAPPEGADDEAAVVPKEPQEAPEITRGMERLVAREVSLQGKEAAFQAREARVQALESELTTLRAAVPSKQILEDFDLNPSGALKAMGKDPETVVRLMIAEQLTAKGQEVPAELQKFVEKAATQREINALKARLEQKDRTDQYAAEFNAVKLGAVEYVKQFVGDSKDSLSLGKLMPTLTDIAKANQDLAHAEIMEEIQRDARARMAADPNGQPITYVEAAKRVEARLAPYKAIFHQGPASTAPTKQVKEAQRQNTVPPQNKPPAAPLKPWQKKDDDLYAQGIKDAEREYYLQEARARRR